MPVSRLDARHHRNAERLLLPHRGELVLAGSISPRWLDGGARFWYTVGTEDGRRFVVADPARGRRDVGFAHDRLAKALAVASGQDVDPAELPFLAIAPTTDAVEFDAFGEHWRGELDTYEGPPAA